MSSSPAVLFMEYFEEAGSWGADEILYAPPAAVEFIATINGILLQADGEASYAALKDCVTTAGGSLYSNKIATMIAIDVFLQRIHPRTVKSNGGFDDVPLDHWLLLLRAQRAKSGFYCEADRDYLIARGPLSRGCRDEFASSALCLSDMFSFLAVVPKNLLNDRFPIQVALKRVDLSLTSGVGPTPSGEESVTFIPVAEDADSLTAMPRMENGRHYVDFHLLDGIDVPEIISKVLKDVVYSDIVMAPELVVSETDAKLISRNLAVDSGRARVILAGSGNTVEKSFNKSWNEASLLNGIGAPLIRQRKVWQAGLDKKRAKRLGLDCPERGLVMEDNCAGTTLNVLDVDGFGRCVILICQDLQAKPLADDLIRLYQPDWVFIPILDSGVSAGRWFHERAYNLSAISPARFLISSSTAHAVKLGYAGYACGMAVGPKDQIGPDAGRVCALAYPRDEKPGYGTVKWREGWGRTDIGLFDGD